MMTYITVQDIVSHPGPVNGWMDGWMDGRTDVYTDAAGIDFVHAPHPAFAGHKPPQYKPSDRVHCLEYPILDSNGWSTHPPSPSPPFQVHGFRGIIYVNPGDGPPATAYIYLRGS